MSYSLIVFFQRCVYIFSNYLSSSSLYFLFAFSSSPLGFFFVVTYYCVCICVSSDIPPSISSAWNKFCVHGRKNSSCNSPRKSVSFHSRLSRDLRLDPAHYLRSAGDS